MKWRSRFAVIAAAVLLSAAAVPIGATALERTIQRDLRADIAWTNVAGPVDQTTRAYRWYPLSYPVLERWSLQDDDSTRSQYAMATIVHFGGPLARHWLDVAIDRDPVICGGGTLPYSLDPGYDAFRAATGLGDESGRKRAAARAVSHLGTPSPGCETFDEQLLAWIGSDALDEIEVWAAHAEPDQLQALWTVLSYDLANSPEYGTRVARLQRLARSAEKPPDAPQPGPAQNPGDAAVYNAVVELNNHDTKGVPLLRGIVDGDLRRLDAVSADSNLLVVATTFPNSRFARGCREYDRLRGGTYFGRDDVEGGPDVPTGSAADWRHWLATYPDHPGADDAAYWLGRTLQRDGRRVDATWVYADTLARGAGDGDMRWALWLRLKFMLDTGTTDDELDAFARLHPASPFAPLAQYARAVRRARANDFRGALALVSQLDLRPALKAANDRNLLGDPAAVNAAYGAQRVRWRRLATLVPNLSTASIETRDRLASAWDDDDGWQIGYLVFFEGEREGGAILWGEPDFTWPGYAPMARAANQNAQTIALAKPLTASAVPQGIRKRNQWRTVLALYRQQTEFPDRETHLMRTLPALPSTAGYDASLYVSPRPRWNPRNGYDRQALNDAAVDAWWTRQTIVEAERFANDYPNDSRAATALLAAFEVSGRAPYLRQIIARYPDGPRTEEARALLWRATAPR
jgi:hypothetical protein